MKHIILSLAFAFGLLACQGVKNEKDNNKSDDAAENDSGSLKDKYQTALLSKDEGGTSDKKEAPDEDDGDKKKGKGIGTLIMSLFDTDGDSMLSVKELNVMVKLTKDLVGNFMGSGMDKPHGKKKFPHHKDGHMKGPGHDVVFGCMDLNKDGTLSKEEFLDAKTKEEVTDCMKASWDDKDDAPDEEVKELPEEEKKD